MILGGRAITRSITIKKRNSIMCIPQITVSCRRAILVPSWHGRRQDVGSLPDWQLRLTCHALQRACSSPVMWHLGASRVSIRADTTCCALSSSRMRWVYESLDYSSSRTCCCHVLNCSCLHYAAMECTRLGCSSMRWSTCRISVLPRNSLCHLSLASPSSGAAFSRQVVMASCTMRYQVLWIHALRVGRAKIQ